METLAMPQQQHTRWTYKITIYSWSNIAASVAMVHYKTYRIGVEMPLCRVGMDKYCNRAITMYYFSDSANAYAMWEVLKYVGKKWNFDAILVHYDWEENRTKTLGQQSHHHHDRECDA